MDAPQAIGLVKSGDIVYVGSNCGQPQTLTDELVRQKDRLCAVEIVHLITFGTAPYVAPGLQESFRHVAFFIGPNTRSASDAARCEYMPVHLGDVPRLFSSGQLPLDVALISVTPPDEHGFVSLGASVDVGLSAAKHAKTVIAEVNPFMPRTLGDCFLHVSEIDAFVPVDSPMLEHVTAEHDEISEMIGMHIAALIDDGATLQTGIGAIPGAVLSQLDSKNDLGVHTELFGPELVQAIMRGNVTCRKKSIYANKVVASFVLGDRHTYDFINNNPFFHFAPTELVNDIAVIAQNDNMVSINGALEVDLTGQVVADSIGHRIYSGVGGQIDFVRGAARSKGGKPIIALPSTYGAEKESRIVTCLHPGAGVVTTRADVHYVVTEYGVAYLHGKSLRERALSMIRIAHPMHRDRLLEEAKAINLIPRDQPSVRHEVPLHMVQTKQLADGTEIVVRPILATDGQMLKKHFYSLSAHAVQRRFNRAVRMLSDQTFLDLVNVDYERHMAVVVTEKDGEAERILGTGRYYLNDITNTAELAFAVLDGLQGKGIGRLMLEALIARAKEMRVGTLLAFVHPANAPMIKLLQTCSVPAEQRSEDGQLVFTLRLREMRQSHPDQWPDLPRPQDRSSP